MLLLMPYPAPSSIPTRDDTLDEDDLQYAARAIRTCIQQDGPGGHAFVLQTSTPLLQLMSITSDLLMVCCMDFHHPVDLSQHVWCHIGTAVNTSQSTLILF